MLATSLPRPRTLEELAGPDLLGRLDRLDIMSRRIFAGKLPGERRSKKRGQSVEFDDYRPYVAGDDLRHIDWNVFARLDRLFIKLFREEEDLALHLVIDGSASMDAGEPSKMAFALRLAMALGYIGLVNQNRLVVTGFGVPGRPGLTRMTPMRGRPAVRRLAHFLTHEMAPARQGAGAPGEVSIVEALRSVALARTGKGVMVVLSDLLTPEDLAPGLNYLASGAGGGFDTYLLRILAPGERDPSLEAGRGLVGDVRLTDVETGRGAEITVSPAALREYRQRFARHEENLRRAATARRMTYVPLTSDQPLGDLLMDYLRRRGLLG
jgi:uncharacterized protein (DUF58 family)